MKITKKELRQIIKEEAIKFKRKLELEGELSKIQKQLDEVYAGEEMDSEKQGGVHTGQRKAEFKTKGSGESEAGTGALVEDEDMEEIEEACDMEAMEEVETMEEANTIEEMEESGEEGDETIEEMEEIEEGEEISENLDEPIEGHSVAQEAEESPVEDGHEKDTHVKESEEVEGEVISEEMKRMQKLAGIKLMKG